MHKTSFYPSLPIFEGDFSQRVSYGGKPRRPFDFAVFS